MGAMNDKGQSGHGHLCLEIGLRAIRDLDGNIN
jgi:hypothetical protein